MSISTRVADLPPNLVRELDEACDRFEADWLSGTPRSLEDALEGTSAELYPVLLRELVSLEMYYKRQAGGNPSPTDYRERFPILDTDWLVDDLVETQSINPSQEPDKPGDLTASNLTRRSIEDYELVGEIARGGMGVILKGRDRELGRDLAFKVLRTELLSKQSMIERFVEEARVSGRLQHPGIIPVYELGRCADGRPYFAMKLVKGRTLANLLAERPDPAYNRGHFIQIFLQICQTVAYAHSKGVIHRDLKPSNVMVGAFGEVLVLDWGLAKVLSHPGTADDRKAYAQHEVSPSGDDLSDIRTVRFGSGSETAAGSVMGTPALMPPEQAGGEVDKLDERADVFGLGGVLCIILSGKPPYLAETAEEIRLMAIRGQLFAAFSRLDECGADADLVALCKHCLEADREKRPRHAGEVAGAIGSHLAGVEERARRAELDRAAAEARATEEANTRRMAEEKAHEGQKRQRAQFALAASIGLLALGCGAFGWWQDRQSSIRRVEAKNQQRDERDRQGRNGEALAALLDRCEESLRANDTAKAEVILEAAEKRVAEGGAEDLLGRMERLRSDLVVLRELEKVDQFRWTPVDNKFPKAKDVAVQFREALGRFGADPETVPPNDVVARVTRSAVRDRLVSAFDFVLVQEKSELIRTALRLADPHPFRDELRDAMLVNDDVKVRDLVGRPQASEQPPGFGVIWKQIGSIPVERRRELLAAAVSRQPGNLGMLMDLGATYPLDQSVGQAEKLRWFQAAVTAAPVNPVPHINLGITLYKCQDMVGAEAEFREAIRLVPNNTDAHNNLGLVLKALNDLSGAEAEYRTVIKIDSKYAPAHTNLGNVLKDLQDLVGAEVEYRTAIKIDPKSAITHNNLGNLLYDLNDLAGAEAEYREAIKHDPKYSPPYIHLGRVFHQRKDLEGAEVELREAIKIDPTDSPARNGLGIILHERKDLKGAEAEFREAIKGDLKFARAHFNLGNVLEERKDLAGAEAEFRETIKLDPKFAPAHVNLGSLLSKRNDLVVAEAEFREAIKVDPKLAAGRVHLGGLLRKRRDLVGAEAEFREAIKVDPKLATAHRDLGEILTEREDLAGAEAELREAIELDPKLASTHGSLGNLLWNQKHVVDAEAEFREAIKLDPTSSSGHNGLGRILLARNEWEGAEAEFRLAIKHNPTYAPAHSSLAELFLKRKDLIGAETEFREAIKLDPTYDRSHYNLGNLLRTQKDLVGAESEYREAIKLNPKFAQVHYNLGLVLMEQKNFAGAEIEFRDVIKLAPSFVPAHCDLGVVLKNQGKLDEAEAEYREAIRINPKYVVAHNNLGNLLREKKDLVGAEAAFREALRLEPKYTLARTNLDRVLKLKAELEAKTAPLPREKLSVIAPPPRQVVR